MTTSTIEIWQKPKYGLIYDDVKLVPFSHLYLIYTKENGQKYVLRAGPSNNSGTELLDDLFTAEGDVSSGPISAILDLYQIKSDGSYPPDWDYENDDTSELIASGSDEYISNIWDTMVSKAVEIHNTKIPYNFVHKNSNTFVFQVVKAAGLSPSIPLNKDGESVFAPGTEGDYDAEINAEKLLGDVLDVVVENSKESIRELIENIDIHYKFYSLIEAYSNISDGPLDSYSYIHSESQGGKLFYTDSNGNVSKVDYPTYDSEADNPPVTFFNDDITGFTNLKYAHYNPEADNPTVELNPDGTLKSNSPVNSFEQHLQNGGDEQSFMDIVGQKLVDWVDDAGTTVSDFFTGIGDLVTNPDTTLFEKALSPFTYTGDFINNRVQQVFGDSAQVGFAIGNGFESLEEPQYFANRDLAPADINLTGSFLVGESDTAKVGGFVNAKGDAGIMAQFSFSDILHFLSGFVDLIKGIFSGTQNHVSPLALNMNRSGNLDFTDMQTGLETSGAYDNGVYFDIDGDGYAEKVGWINAEDGQLAMDRNGNGQIDDITELFGDDVMPAFEKLALHDTNKDGKISAGDEDFDNGNLLVWQDLNQNGVSEAIELKSLLDAGVKEISLAETTQDFYQNENYISGVSTFTWTDNTQGEIADVHFLNDNVNTWFKGAASEQFGSDIEVNLEAILLPLSRGYGSLPSLHIAMTDNPGLKGLMKELVAMDASDVAGVAAKMETFLYRWAGVENNDPNSRATLNGSNIDARKVDFLEQFTGVEWKQLGLTSVVGSKASLGVKKAWAEIANLMTARILVQGTWAEIFPNASYDFKTDTITLGDTMADIITAAQNYIATTPAEAHDFWLEMGNILIMHQDELGATVGEISNALDAAYGQELFIDTMTLTSADGDIYTNRLGGNEVLETSVLVGTDTADNIDGSNANDYIFGRGGDDVIDGRGGDDFIRGDDGADILKGGDGDDRLEGVGGADRLEGGAGRDDLRAGASDDTLLGGDGDDKLHGGAGADILDGGAGSDEIDYLESDAGVFVDLRTGENHGGHAEGDVYSNIENMTGSDYSDYLVGDAQDNLINGERGNDIIKGGRGNDNLFGAQGEDKLYGQQGNDVLQGFEGAEYMDGGEGIDEVNYSHPFNDEGVYVDLAAGKGYSGAAQDDVYVDIENIAGTNHDDILIGNDDDNILVALEGNDVLKGGAGNDVLVSGGKGIKWLTGGSGNDVFRITPDLTGTIYITDFNIAEDILDYRDFTSDITTATEVTIAPNGNDILLLIGSGHSVILKNISPDNLTSNNFNFSGTTIITTTPKTGINASGVVQSGDAYGNKLVGSFNADTIDGNDGNDVISGFEGDDILLGGTGEDTLIGGDGADTMDGGSEEDWISYIDSYEGVNINLASGTASGGTATGDSYTNIENLEGSKLNDVLAGDIHSNRINGEDGDDIINGGGGADILTGGRGSDQFVISMDGGTISYIEDFDVNNTNEKIDLSAFNLSELQLVFNTSETYISVRLPNNQVLNLEGISSTDFAKLSASHFIFSGATPTIKKEIQGDGGNNILVGGDGNDTIFAQNGVDHVYDGKGNDSYSY